MKNFNRISLVTFVLCSLFINFGLFAAEKITLDHIYREHLFKPETVSGIRSMNDGLYYTILEEHNKIVKYSFETGERVSLIFDTGMDERDRIRIIEDYSFNSDESVLLISTQQEQIYRYSYRSNYYAYLMDSKKVVPVFSEGMQQDAKLSPGGRKVAFVYENDLFFKDLATSKVTRITSDGKKDHIINGVPDWVYEEEFTLKSGYYWSPDGNKIAFYKFDESRVKEYIIPKYSGLYPEWMRYKYPKTGEENSVVEIYVYDLISGETQRMKLPQEEHYIPRIKWLPNSKEICITKLNRLQNKAELLFCNAENGESKLFYAEEDENYITEFTDDFITFIDSGRQALIMSERDEYMHLYRYNREGDLLNSVTTGEWEIDDLIGYNKEDDVIYYTSTEKSPLERHIYSIHPDGTDKKQISTRHGVNEAVFSTTFKYYIIKHSDANSPLGVYLYNKKGKLIRVLEDNLPVKQRMNEFGFAKKEFFSFQITNGTLIYGYQILPPDFNKNEKYPVLVYVYGGPESQDVKDEWDRFMPWFQLLAQKGYIVVCADNRGTDGRGEAFKKATYMQLGNLETQDQIALAEYMAEKSYVDSERIGIFGWSYGGYMSLLCLTKGNRIFSMGIAVAPVTNWRYYDTVYTERFMRKPGENEYGYDENSPINHMHKLKGKLLLIHGTADDNVHVQNSMELIKSLVENDKQFDMQLYPDKNHGIYGGNTTYHLYTRMTEYILNNL